MLNGDTAEEVWNLCNDKLQHDPKLTVRGLIEQSNVAFIGTTDDPIDSLEWHKKIKEDPTIKFTVAPSFRPDKAVNIQKPGFAEYMAQAGCCCGQGEAGLHRLRDRRSDQAHRVLRRDGLPRFRPRPGLCALP